MDGKIHAKKPHRAPQKPCQRNESAPGTPRYLGRFSFALEVSTSFCNSANLPGAGINIETPLAATPCLSALRPRPLRSWRNRAIDTAQNLSRIYEFAAQRATAEVATLGPPLGGRTKGCSRYAAHFSPRRPARA